MWGHELTLAVIVPAGSVIVPTGSVVTTGSVIVPAGSVIVPTGSVVTTGSVIVPAGSVIVPTGSVVTTGSVIVPAGSVITRQDGRNRESLKMRLLGPTITLIGGKVGFSLRVCVPWLMMPNPLYMFLIYSEDGATMYKEEVIVDDGCMTYEIHLSKKCCHEAKVRTMTLMFYVNLVLNDLKVGKAPEVPFVANDVTYKWGYYLTERDIYQIGLCL
ncbi:hypothetical protein Tco_0268202 [Tanacetum coccineum]